MHQPIEKVEPRVPATRAHEPAGRLGVHATIEHPFAPRETDGPAVGGLHPSDHRAVVCDLAWSA